MGPTLVPFTFGTFKSRHLPFSSNVPLDHSQCLTRRKLGAAKNALVQERLLEHKVIRIQMAKLTRKLKLVTSVAGPEV